MKKQFSALIAVILISLSALAQPDTLWTQAFGGIGGENGYSVQQTSDGGYIIAGRTNSYGAGLYDVYLIKTDENGNEQWFQPLGGYHNDGGYSVQQTSDGGYIIAGYTYSYGAGSADVYLIKTDENGNEQWSQTFGGIYHDEAWCVQQTSDGGYIIVGWGYSYTAGCEDVYLIKTDENGNETWFQTLGGSDLDEAWCVQQTSDGGYIIAGTTGSILNLDVYLIKTDAHGNEIWSQTFGGNDTDWGWCVQQTSDGGYIITGYTNSYGAGGADVYLIKTDAQGNEQWSQTFGGSNYDYGFSVQQTSDGGYIIAGSTYCFGALGADFYLIKTNENGNESWFQIFDGSELDEAWCVQQTSDGGYIIAGTTGAGLSNVWLIRVESEAPPPPITLTLTPHNPPIQIPSGGGSFNFDLEIDNGTATNYTIDVSTYVTLPGGTTYPILSRYGINLTSGASIIRNLTQFVPGGTPSGNYAYNGYVYDHNTWELLARDSFPFEKLTGDDSPNHNLGWALCGWEGEDASLFSIPRKFSLFATPNPFNPETNLTFDLPHAGEISLIIYDIAGREIVRLIDGFQPAGTHETTFDASQLVSGVYFARLTAGSFHQTQKLLLVK